MKRLLFTIISTTICLSVNAQQLKQRQNSFRSNETLGKRVPQ